MSTATTTTAMSELQKVIDRIQSGVRDPQAARSSLATLQSEREELRKKIGTVEAAVDLVREARDQ
jgi:hypothetical protein